MDEEESIWHDITASSFLDVVPQRRVVVLTQIDVSKQMGVQQRLEDLLEHEHKVLESMFPRHVIEYMTVQRDRTATATKLGAEGGGGMSASDSMCKDAAKLATKHENVTILFAVRGRDAGEGADFFYSTLNFRPAVCCGPDACHNVNKEFKHIS